ncbi:histidine phosphatase family protein [Streptomyces hesseae]|uniref:Histidine phosphatase family protein n=1 Tax=Streptomyces hesseae TaxID=3075519 RepID=A0ABU2SK64_9ACTN|nr:histidine phosphatase family protein [Streptomyces sp. DSM 40473]MDT0449372.1 histidine phosphatase family protein [Streptomyces sp. DSM 40473]
MSGTTETTDTTTSGGGPARIGRRRVLAVLAGATLLPVTGCGSDSGPRAAGPSEPPPDGRSGPDATIMIIRHGEKPRGSTRGMDENGEPDKKSLTQRGWERARALPKLFAPATGTSGADASGRTALPRPSTLFAAADYGPNAGSRRMRQTVTPLAEELKLPVNTSFSETEEAKLATAALMSPQPVLICWEHSRIADIVKALGAAKAPGVPKSWPDRFDLVWVLTRHGGTWSFRSVPQHLLDGDAAATRPSS